MTKILTVRSYFQSSIREILRRRLIGRVTILVAMAIIIALTYAVVQRPVVLNLSPSLPFGLYVTVHEPPAVGRLIEFQSPNSERRGNQNSNSQTILKQIWAGPGDEVNSTGEWLLLNQRRIAPIYTVDTKGRELLRWRANRPLEQDEYFVFSPRVPNSFDSRYFGPIRRCNIIAVRAPLWIWGERTNAVSNCSEPP